MYFKSEDHEDLTNVFIKSFGMDHIWMNKEYGVFCYLVAATGKDDLLNYCSPSGIDVDELLDEIQVYSSSEKAMIRLGLQLFNGSIDDITIHDVFYHLDEYNEKVVMEALKLRFKVGL